MNIRMLRRASAGALALTLIGATAAFASDVDVAVVDVIAPTTSVELAPGASGSITINLSVTGNQVGTATFEVYRDWTLSGGTFTGSNPQEFTVLPRGGGDPATTFSTTGTVSVGAGQASGAFTLAVGAFDITNSNTTGAKLAAGDSSSYVVNVVPGATDSTPPTIGYTLDPASPDGANGWYTSDVALTWTVTENESPGSLVTSGCVDQTITSDQLATDYTCSATSDGGSADEVTVSIKRDAAAPEVSLDGGPADGGVYYFGFVPAVPSCDASDATSGLDGDCSVSGYSTAIGTHTVTASAKDLAGNEATQSRAYEVKAWTLNGFYAPVDLKGTLNTVKAGSTVPLKFEVFAGSDELKDTSVIQSFSAQRYTCSTGSVEDAIEFTTTGGTSLRFDATGDQFIQNWQTPKSGAGNCYLVTMTTDDGSFINATFKLK